MKYLPTAAASRRALNTLELDIFLTKVYQYRNLQLLHKYYLWKLNSTVSVIGKSIFQIKFRNSWYIRVSYLFSSGTFFEVI